MIPVVFIHEAYLGRGQFKGLTYAIKSAQHFNPDGRVVLIGDDEQPKDLCEFSPVASHSAARNEFKAIWDVLAADQPNSWFTWATLTPWLLLCEWCEANGVDRVCHLDSDVLTFCDVTKEGQHWLGFDFTASSPEGNPQAPIFVRTVVLKAFRAWLLQISREWLRLDDHTRLHGLHAMEAWRLFQVHYGWHVGDTSRVIHDSTWCHNWGMDYHGYEWDGEGKQALWIMGRPSVMRRGSLVRFNNIHCWGNHKQRMQSIWEQSQNAGI